MLRDGSGRRVRQGLGCASAAALAMGLVGGVSHAQPVRRAAPASPAEASVVPPKAFRFSDGAVLSPGLSFEMSRPFATVDAAGRSVEADEARFGLPVTIASSVTMSPVRSSLSNTTIFGSGFDHDGVTPLLVLRDTTLRVLDVFSVADEALKDAEITGVGRERTPLAAGSGTDVMRGAIADRRYEPCAAVVCHGMIVLLCIVSEPAPAPSSVWKDCAMAFVVSQDRGKTWEMVYEDEHSQTGVHRGREWCMQNWWPGEGGTDPTVAYIAATDYRFQPAARGGRVIAFRASRGGVGEGWTIDPPCCIYDAPETYSQHHAHAAGIVAHGDGLRVAVAMGDGQGFSRIVVGTREDRMITPEGWTFDEAFHGSTGTAGNQFVGCAPSGVPGAMIVGADLSDDQIALVDVSGEKARHAWLYGGPWSNATSSQNFGIRTPTPERGGPYCAVYDPQKLTPAAPAGSKRLIYSDDGLRWAQMLAPGNELEWCAAIHGSHVYIDGEVTAVGSLRRATLPRLFTARPLQVGPGGMQRLASSPAFASGAGGTIVALTRDAEGRWEDGGVALEPQPPCMGQVWKVSSPLGLSSTLMADIWPMALPTLGQATGSSNALARLWVMNASEEKAATPRIEIKPTGSGVIKAITTSINSTDAWTTVDFALTAPMPNGQRPLLRFRSGTSATDEQAVYVACAGLTEGAGFPGYPTGPDTSASSSGTAYPDEHASITGLKTLEKWTVTLAGMLPQDGWDVGVPAGSGVVWPLVTLWASEEERLTFSADTAQGKLVASLEREGATAARFELDGLVWTRGSPLLVSVARNGPGEHLGITVAACGREAREMQVAGGVTGVATLLGAPREIRFDDGTGIDGVGMEVRASSMLWFGGEIHEYQALDAAARRERLATLPFLVDEHRVAGR